jgi:hypothetical protein
MDFSPQLERIQHASSRWAEFTAEIVNWTQENSFELTPEISDDQFECALVLRVQKMPNLTRWGLLFGEIVHHLRATLDNFACEIAAQSSQTSSISLTDVQFPIYRNRKDWDDSGAKKIKKLPLTCRNAIFDVQPFHLTKDGVPPEDHCLAILNILDNADKHQVHIRLSSGQEIDTEHNSAVETFDTEFQDGAVVMRFRSQVRIESADLQGHGYSMGFNVVMPDGRTFYTIVLLRELIQCVESIVSQIITRTT